MSRINFSGNRKMFLGFAVGLIIIGLVIWLNRGTTKNNLQSPVAKNQTETPVKIQTSETFIEYSDPVGFKFNYPDNLSLAKNDDLDSNTYSDVQLYTKGVNGSLSLNISDTKLKTLQEWLKDNQISTSITPKDVKLGNMKAMEVKTTDRLMLVAIDQGVLFTIEMPLIEEDFWMKVYNKVVSDFSFNAPSNQNLTSGEAVNSSSDDVSFEGEEVVE